MSEVTNLLDDIKKYRNDMVARNYPHQQISNIITKWEQHLAAMQEIQDKETSHKDWIDGYNKWKASQ